MSISSKQFSELSIIELQHELDLCKERIRSYNIGDRPQSPPVDLLRFESNLVSNLSIEQGRINKWKCAFDSRKYLFFDCFQPLPIKFEDIVKIFIDGWETDSYFKEIGSAIGLLRNGKYVSLEGGCDSTGWDCESWLEVKIFDNYGDAYWLGLTDPGRDRLSQ